MHPSRELPSTPTTVALLVIAVTLWLLLRGYHGLTGDGQIYAFQALARIHPYLSTDLYLQNTSQDQFTIFSGVYSWFIQLLGLEHAARWLTLLLTFWLLAAAWSAARAVSGRDAAWLAVAFLLIVEGGYGASGVFRISEPFLTARLPAEALAITALSCYLNGMRLLGLVIAGANLFVHPLIALPGLLLLVSLWVANRTSVVGAIAGLLATLLIAGAAVFLPSVGRFFPLMDSAWLNVVQERSQFLFLPLWSFRDWDLNSRSFLNLAFTAIAIPDLRIRKLCMAAALVGIAGLGGGTHRQLRRPRRVAGAGPGMAMGLDSGLRQRDVAAGRRIEGLAGQQVWTAVRALTGVRLDAAGGQWNGMRFAGHSRVGDAGPHQRALRDLSAMGGGGSRRCHRSVGFGTVVKHRHHRLACPGSHAGRSTTTGNLWDQNLCRAVRGDGMVVRPIQPQHLGSRLPLRDAPGPVGFHRTSGIQAISHTRRGLGN